MEEKSSKNYVVYKLHMQPVLRYMTAPGKFSPSEPLAGSERELRHGVSMSCNQAVHTFGNTYPTTKDVNGQEAKLPLTAMIINDLNFLLIEYLLTQDVIIFFISSQKFFSGKQLSQQS